jgi:phosphomannomutase
VGETTGIATETAERNAADSLQALARLTSFVKAYDVRGLVGSQLTSDVSRAIGYAFARFVAGQSPAVVIAYDMRESSPELAGAYAEGVTSAGLDVVMAGLGSTDMLYFASGRLNLPGAMFTASHNPARYNGIKMCLAGAVPISLETGLAQVRDDAQALLDGAPPAVADRRGTVTERNLLADYADYLRTLVDLSQIRPLHVVVDAGNGMAGYTVPAVFDGLPLRTRSCTSSSTAASPTTRRTRWNRPIWSTCSRRCAGPVPTSGWRSTATRIAASSSTRRVIRSRPARSPGWSPPASCAAIRGRRSCTT